MSVLIKNLDMPKNCMECMFWARSVIGVDRCFIANKELPCDCPLIEVPEQKHGKWKKAYLDHEAFGIRPTVVYCSECNLVGYWEPKYCPNCGARMDGES